jgi:hypothetical protein
VDIYLIRSLVCLAARSSSRLVRQRKAVGGFKYIVKKKIGHQMVAGIYDIL